jgi:SAM-dependent methyltransferase
LTNSLACFGFSLTSIDIGPSMISTARRYLDDANVLFQVASFEEFEGAAESIDLIVSGTAFHWVDPDVRFRKAARLLRPGGWLAVLSTAEVYDDPLGSALVAMWSARSPNVAWAKQPPGPDIDFAATGGLFDVPVQRTHSQRLVAPTQVVVGVENTRATSLSWPGEVRADFTSELRDVLRGHNEVRLTQQTWLVMAQAR